MDDDTGETAYSLQFVRSLWSWLSFVCQINIVLSSIIQTLALITPFFASTTTRMFGCKASVFGGGLFFLVGALLHDFAINIEMLIVGRLLLGFVVGYCNQVKNIANLIAFNFVVTPKQSLSVYLSEMAPTIIRGALNIGFQMIITIGILGDTPNCMIESGQKEGAKKMLQKICGIDNVDEEFQHLIDASEEAKKVNNLWKNIIQPRCRPQHTFCYIIPFFQQLTDINIIMIYAPMLFKTLDFGNDISLMSAVIIGGVIVVATFVSIFIVDTFGRRILSPKDSVQMLICHVKVES
ncbi:sugar transport protein 10-like [Cicer arietinum]|uniref:sugar transport protein 10-like n=1 Tax=Cicer arietinum TaxID=3827 RepID=UPI003CC667CD